MFTIGLREILDRLRIVAISGAPGGFEIVDKQQAITEIKALHNRQLDYIVRHLKDLESALDIQINSGVTWQSIIDMHKFDTTPS